MAPIIETLREFSIFTTVIRLVLALALGGFIGIERGKRGRPAGFRTHILVCCGGAMTALVSLYVTYVLGTTDGDIFRIPAQVISGIGFLGVGTILVTGRTHVRGLTTAAGLWNTAAIGIACGYGFYEGAIIGTVLSVLTNGYLFRIETVFYEKNKNIEVYIELDSIRFVTDCVKTLTRDFAAKNIEVCAPRTAVSGNVGIEAAMSIGEKSDKAEVLENLNKVDGVVFALESK